MHDLIHDHYNLIHDLDLIDDHDWSNKDIYFKLLLDLDLLIDNSNEELKLSDYNKLVDDKIIDIISYFVSKYNTNKKLRIIFFISCSDGKINDNVYTFHYFYHMPCSN